MKTFLLIAMLHGNTYVLDSGLSAEDCMSAIVDGVTRIEVSEGHIIPAKGAVLACESEVSE